jgi:hypothetical protein
LSGNQEVDSFQEEAGAPAEICSEAKLGEQQRLMTLEMGNQAWA